MNQHPRLDPWIEGYLGYLADVSRKAAGTVRDIRCSLRRIIRFMEGHRPAALLWELSFSDFLVWVQAERSMQTSPRSIAKYLCHARGLLDYAWRGGRAQRNVLDGFTLQDDQQYTKPPCLSEAEARQLIESCPQASAIDRRDRAILLLLYGCGLRTFELTALRLEDVNHEQRELLIRHGKGDRQRLVPVPDGVYTELLAYLAQRGGKQGPLFRTAAKRHRLRSQEVCRVVRQAAVRAGLGPQVTPKVLRHSYATHLMDRGVDLAVIASLMGHRSPQETGVYLHVLGSQSKEAVDRLNGDPPKGESP
jgi:integrase/recombinase XerD